MEKKNDHFLKRITRYFVENFRIAILLLLLIIASGTFSLLTTRRDDTPPINVPFYIVTAAYPGASASDIETDIIDPVESEIKDIAGVKKISSTSSNSFGSVVIEMEANGDLEKIKTDIKSAAEKAELPEEAESLKFAEAGFDDRPFMYIGMVGDMPFKEMQEKATKLAKDFEQIDGVKKTDILGEKEEKVFVTVDLEKLKDAGLTTENIKQAVQGRNVSLPGGEIENESGILPIEIKGEIASLDELRQVEITNQQTRKTFKLEDLASVEYGFEEDTGVRVAAVHQDEDYVVGPSLLIGVVKKDNADLIDTSENVEQFLNDIESNEEYELFVGYNSADSVNQQIQDLVNNALLGSIIILIVLSFFVSLRGSIVVTIAIPLVLLATFAVFSFAGLSFNVITLFALLITLGLLVDNAIVIVEAIQYGLERGKDRKEAAIEAVGNVGPAILSSTLTTVLVFLPLAFIPGITGEFIKYIPYVVISSIVSSFIIAIAISPFIGSLVMKLTKKHKARIKERGIHSGFIEKLGNHIKRNIESRLRKWAIFALTFVFLIMSFSLPGSGTLKSETWPAQDDAEFASMELVFPTGTKISQKNDVVKQVLEKLGEVEDLQAVVPIEFDNTEDVGLTMVFDKDKELTATEIVNSANDAINNETFSVPQGEVEVTASLFAEGPPQAAYDMTVQVFGDDIEAVKNAAKKATEELAEYDEIEEVANTAEEDLVKKIRVALDAEKIKDAGANQFLVAGAIRPIFTEDELGSFTNSETKNTSDVVLEFSAETKDSLDDIKTIPVQTLSGVKNLEDLATIEEIEDVVSIKHSNTKRFVEVNINLKEDVVPQQFQQKLTNEYFTDEKLEELGIAEGSLEFGGGFADQEEEFGNLGQTFMIAMLLVYLVLVAQFKSFVQPFVILLTVPLALILVFPGLLATGQVLSFFAGIGIIALVGIVVNDAIILIDAINRYRKEGMKRNDAITEAVKDRFKPILATSITTIGGVLPLAIASPFMAALAYALVFGLLSSTIFTLYVVPLIYATLTKRDDKKKKSSKKKTKAKSKSKNKAKKAKKKK